MGQNSVTEWHWEVANLGWLGERSATFRREVSSHVLLRRYSSGDYPHHVGDEAGGIYGVIEGSFGTYAASDAAGIVLGHIFREGAWFGQGPITSGKPRYLSFKAMEPSVILYLPPAALNQIAHSFPGARAGADVPLRVQPVDHDSCRLGLADPEDGVPDRGRPAEVVRDQARRPQGRG